MNDPIKPEQEAVARWLAQMACYWGASTAEWDAFLEYANDIIAIIERARNNVTTQKILYNGRTIIVSPNGSCEIIETF